jgi:hypothetical protein
MEKLLLKYLGISGRMISASKSMYRGAKPRNLIVFNGNLITEIDGAPRKIWYGDIDISADRQSLISLANELNSKIYVLTESNARFENEASPKIENFIYSVDQDGNEMLGDFIKEYYSISDEIIENVENN